jgi:hypothetical protein
MMRNKKQFLTNSEIYHINTRQQANLHLPPVNVTKYQKGVYYQGIKVFNALPPYIKMEFDNPMKFKRILQKCLHENSFYSLNEYFDKKKTKYKIWLDTSKFSGPTPFYLPFYVTYSLNIWLEKCSNHLMLRNDLLFWACHNFMLNKL